MRRLSCTLACLALVVSSAGGAVKTIAGVPAYIWWRGCGPTAGGQVIGYWDSQGFGNLIVGSNDWNTNRANIENMIASPEHYNDYSLPLDDPTTGIKPDKSSLGGAHANNSVADFMLTSMSRYHLYYGGTYSSMMGPGMANYAAYKGYPYSDYSSADWGTFTWDNLVTEIDQNRPVIFFVDNNGDGSPDHFVTAIGYDDTSPGNLQYLAYNTWYTSVQTYAFRGVAPGNSWGIYSATTFLVKMGGDANLDRYVDIGDLAILASNYELPSGMTWAEGDFSGDGAVDISDLAILASNFDIGPGSGGTSLVPEPFCLTLLAAGALGLLRRRGVR